MDFVVLQQVVQLMGRKGETHISAPTGQCGRRYLAANAERAWKYAHKQSKALYDQAFKVCALQTLLFNFDLSA